jgi:hypothetical protein
MKRFLKQFGLLLAMMLVGTLIDFAVHSTRQAWYVEFAYFPAKIIFGTVWGYIAFRLLRRTLGTGSVRGLALGVPALIALFLQTKYFYQGRDLGFVFFFMFAHYLMFLPPAFFIFSRYRQTFTGGPATAPSRPRWDLFIGAIVGLEAAFYLYFRLLPPF